MSSSVGIIIPNIWKVIQKSMVPVTTNQKQYSIFLVSRKIVDQPPGEMMDSWVFQPAIREGAQMVLGFMDFSSELNLEFGDFPAARHV